MKELLIIFIHALTTVTLMAGSVVTPRDTLPRNRDERLTINNSVEAFLLNPGELRNWNYSDFTEISVSTSLSGGDFKTVDDFEKNVQYSFSSRSVQTFKDTGWRFYGDFSLSVSNHQNADWNLGFERSSIGSPFRLITQREGDFNVKRYALTGIMNKELGDNLSLSLAVKYHGDLFFRLSDTRNEFYNLLAELPLALNFSVSENSNISLGLAWFYKKGSPIFSNEYLASTPDYYLYFNKGAGDFMKIDMGNTYYLNSSNPKYFIGFFSGKKNRFSIAYSAHIGKEHWDNKITSTLAVIPKELFRYQFFNNELLSTLDVERDNFSLLNKVGASFVNGTGYENGTILQKTYTYYGLKVQGTSELLLPRSSLFYLSRLGIDLEHTGKRDMIYGQEIIFTNIIAKGRTGYLIGINKKNSFTINAEGSYKHNLSYFHDVVSAGSKIYTINLGHNEVAYNTANLCSAGGEIEWVKLSGKNLYRFSLGYNYFMPVLLKVQNQYSVLTKETSWQNLEAGLNIYF